MGVPDLFFPTEAGQFEHAKLAVILCRACTWLEDCARDADEHFITEQTEADQQVQIIAGKRRFDTRPSNCEDWAGARDDW